MQTVNFQCGHCRKVMGVSSAFLGKQVRCPHCQQVVLAPSQAGPPPAPGPSNRPPSGPNFNPPATTAAGKDEYESIFGEHVDDDLFGAAPKPTLELPPEPPRPAPAGDGLQLEPTVFSVPGVTPPAPNPATEPTGAGLAPTMASNSAAAVADRPALFPASNPAIDGAPAPTITSVPRPSASSGGSLVPWYIIGILVPYAVLMTIAAIWYYVQWRSAPSPMEMLPDMGDPKARQTSQVIRRIKPSTELPPNLITQLGQPIRIGDLEVTPQKVEQKCVTFKSRFDKNRGDKQTEDSLVLHLDFKNLSKKTEFRPTDSMFDYRWRDRSDPESTMPYTYLTIGGVRYCGPGKRDLRNERISSTDNLRIEYVAGQEQDSRILKPGETSSTVIVTEPAEQAPLALRTHRGKLLWRVQLRRGLVEVDGKDVSATGVIGVEFDKDQILKAEN